MDQNPDARELEDLWAGDFGDQWVERNGKDFEGRAVFWSGLLGISGIRAVGNEAPLYGAAMALAGALSGGCGSLLQGWLWDRRSITASGP